MKKLALIFLLLMTVFTAHAQDENGVRVRLAHLSYDAGELDLMVDGQAVASASFGTVTHYFAGNAGNYQLAVVPTGAGIDAAVLGPVDMPLEAGHSYTLAAVGQQADMSFSPLLIDETLTLQNAGVDTDRPMLVLNAVSGAPAFDIYAGDTPVAAQLSFGGYAVAEAPEGQFDLRATPAGEPENEIFLQSQLGLANNMLLVAFAGIADDYNAFVSNASDLNAIEFLTGLSGTPYSADSLLGAINAAGLTDALSTQGPVTIFAPIDSAFAAIPTDTLNGVLADPATLTSVLGYHIVPSYVPSADIVSTLIEDGSVTLTTTQGGDISITNTDGLVQINGSAQLLGVDYYVSNGVIHFIDAVLMP